MGQKFHQKFVLQSVIFLGDHQKRLQKLEPTKFGATNIFRPVTSHQEEIKPSHKKGT